jgi:glycosyltransferase involved in cell wall biosynthesis
MAGALACISVVVTSCNRATSLPQVLDAILAQTLAPREIIVVDDGFTSATQAVLERYTPRVTMLRTAISGDLAARNAGLRMARGELVAFCDGNALWRPGYLLAMARMWSSEPRLGVAFGDSVNLLGDDWNNDQRFADAPEGFWAGLRSIGPGQSVFEQQVVARLLEFQPFFPSCMVARRRFLLEIGGWDISAGRVAGMDFATLLRLAEYAPFGVMHLPLVGIRQRDQNDPDDVQGNLGSAWVLEHLLGQRHSLSPHAAAISAGIVRRRVRALDLAFAQGDFVVVREIGRLLPAGPRPLTLWLKIWVAGLVLLSRPAAGGLFPPLGPAGAGPRRLTE